MLLRRHPHSSRRLILTITCTVIALFHQIEGFPVLVKKAGAVLGPPPSHILPNSDASWFRDSSAVSTLVTRSTEDVVHDSVFIPTIATMGVLVIICILCSYRLFVTRDTAHSRGAYTQGPIYSSQYASGHVDGSQGSRISKSASATVPGSPSVGSNMLDRLQRRREEEHRQLQQQDPYEQYVSSNQGYPQQHYHTPHPSMPGSVVPRGEGMQPQLPHTAHVQNAQPPLMNVSPSREQNWGQQERQSWRQSDPRWGVPRSSVAPTSSTRVSSDVLSYATPPEARRPPLPGSSSQPQTQDYFTSQYPGGGIPLQAQPSAKGDIAHSVPANYTPSKNSPQDTHVHGSGNQLPAYSTEMMRSNVQGNVANTTPRREKN